VKARWLFGRVAKREFLGIEKLLENPLTSALRCAILQQLKELSENDDNIGTARFVGNQESDEFLLMMRSTLTIEMWKAELELVMTREGASAPCKRGSESVSGPWFTQDHHVPVNSTCVTQRTQQSANEYKPLHF
jgi:hypothetical protein